MKYTLTVLCLFKTNYAAELIKINDTASNVVEKDQSAEIVIRSNNIDYDDNQRQKLLCAFFLRNQSPVLGYYLQKKNELKSRPIQLLAYKNTATKEYQKLKQLASDSFTADFLNVFNTLEDLDRYIDSFNSQIFSSLEAPLKILEEQQICSPISASAPPLALIIECAEEKHYEQIWEIFKSILEEGATYFFDQSLSREESHEMWMSRNVNSYVALVDQKVVGAYMIKPNFPHRGAHVANGSYIVSESARNNGVGRILANHSFEQAKRLGYQAMRFNMVVSTNTSAVHLWQSVGMKIIGVSPKSFQHKVEGLVDTYIMYKDL